MAGLFPLAGVHHLRGLDLAIAGAVDGAAHIALQLAPDAIALGVPEHAAMRLGLQMEQVHLAAQLAVVALGGLLQPDQMRIQLLFVQPAGAVNPAQHRVILIAAPIGARHAGQLERGGVQLAGRGQMRPLAHIQPVIARPIDGQFLVLGQFGGPLGLETLALLLPTADQLRPAPHLAAQRLVGGDNLAHFRLNRWQIFIGERAILGREIIVETIVGRWTKGDLRARKQRLHRFGQHMGEIVAGKIERVGLIARGHQRQRAIAREGAGQIHQLPIDSRGNRRLGEAGADRGGNISRGGPRRHLAHGTIGQGDLDHIRHG